MSTNVRDLAIKERATSNAPNVRLAHDQQPVTIEGNVNIGGTPSMYLPDEAQQRKGFWVSHPEILVTQFFPRYRYALPMGRSVADREEGQNAKA